MERCEYETLSGKCRIVGSSGSSRTGECRCYSPKGYEFCNKYKKKEDISVNKSKISCSYLNEHSRYCEATIFSRPSGMINGGNKCACISDHEYEMCNQFRPIGGLKETYMNMKVAHGYTEVKNCLCTSKYTRVLHESNVQKEFGNAPHDFVVCKAEENGGEVFAKVKFQEGPIKEFGVNGVANEDLLLMVLTRLEAFQNGEFSCRDNALAITELENVLLRLRKRTLDREMRNVEGTNEV